MRFRRKSELSVAEMLVAFHAREGHLRISERRGIKIALVGGLPELIYVAPKESALLDVLGRVVGAPSTFAAEGA